MITAPLLHFDWLVHGFGLRDSIPPAELTTATQIHSALVLDACGRRGAQIGEGDAIISTEPGVAIGIRTADCVPILIADEKTKAIAAVHAGWRGTAENIIGATIDRLRGLGCDAADLSAAIGPSIGSCCYEVSADVARQFELWQPLSKPGERITLDLPAINESQLREAGVGKIWKSGACTFCHPDLFYSFRREKAAAGRMISFVNRTA